MARSKKKVVVDSDTITFKKTELLEKLKVFLERHDACSNDWINKVGVEFLGLKEQRYEVEFMVPCRATILMATSRMPTNEEVHAFVLSKVEDGDWEGFDIDNNNFEVKSVKLDK